MKKVFLLLSTAACLAACSNTANTAADKKDSVDSIANAKKDVIDSTAQQKKEMVDSAAERTKDKIDRMDSAKGSTHASDTTGKKHTK